MIEWSCAAPPTVRDANACASIAVPLASRRLKSDRFFTDDYKAELYTEFGLKYIRETTMLKVLLRHYPELAPALKDVKNAFKPWHTVAAGAPGPGR